MRVRGFFPWDRMDTWLSVAALILMVSACNPSVISQNVAETFVPTSTIAPFTATVTRTPKPPTETLPPTPDFEATNAAIGNAVMTASPPRLYASYSSPDNQWQVEIIIYDCVQVEDGVDLNAYEQLNLIEVSTGAMEVIDTQLQNCGGIGAFGLEGRFWSPNSQYFSYTDAREGVPDGGCGYWEPPLRRLEIASQHVEEIGMGPISPDRTKLATWLNTDFVVWSLDEGELARSPVIPAEAVKGPIAWSPDGEALVYVQTEGCFPFGKSYIVKLDLPGLKPELLIESIDPTFIGVTWDAPDWINLSDEDGKAWKYDLKTKELQPIP